MKTLPIEWDIVEHLKVFLNNKRIKPKDIQEWTTSKEIRDKKLLEDEMAIDCCGVFVAVKKSIDKRK